MPWNKRLTQLNDALALLLPFPNSALPFLQRSNINFTMINFDGGPLIMWHNILSYSENNGLVDRLVDVILEQNPQNPYLLTYKESGTVLREYNLGEDIRKTTWKNSLDNESLEKITGGKSTLLPIKFLAIGIERAKSVARIRIPRQSKIELGSGFLLPNNLLITNNHVIPDTTSAQAAVVEFNYEESINGNAIEPSAFKLQVSENNFFTSKENDLTIVRIDGDANQEFGHLDLSTEPAQKGDFVNIIQHPGGRYKQIGLYHNIVMYTDDKCVQYLTDTEPGTSGSPVFNSDWEVVAIHNSGGVLLEPGTTMKFLRNQGVNRLVLKKMLEESNLI